MSVGTCVFLVPAIYNFHRLINIVLKPRRDFRGVPPNPTAQATTLGLNDQSVFSEIELDKIKHDWNEHYDCHQCQTDEEARELHSLACRLPVEALSSAKKSLAVKSQKTRSWWLTDVCQNVAPSLCLVRKFHLLHCFRELANNVYPCVTKSSYMRNTHYEYERFNCRH